MLRGICILVAALACSCSALSDELLTPREQAFLTRHWPGIIPPQGGAPAAYSELERSLSPADCGACHPREFEDWRSSLHSRTMGPGVLGQLLGMGDDQASTRMCGTCHAPNAEQQAWLAVDAGPESGFRANPHFDPLLRRQGIVCAGCHVRQHRRYGPPPANAPGVAGRTGANGPHGGFTAESAFTRSAFCSTCHQFTEDDRALNGKLLENTYEEWKASRYPAEGVQCQTCHMPGRRHLWRGIHDPGMVRQGVTVSVDVEQFPRRPGDTVKARVTIANTGTGHHFPTYMTPKVFVRGYLVDEQGKAFPGTLQEAVIGREATPGLSREIYDTRIPAHGSLTVLYEEAVRRAGLRLKVEIEVHPDHFYVRFFENYLSRALEQKARGLIEAALAQARETPFTLFERTFPLSLENKEDGGASAAARERGAE